MLYASGLCYRKVYDTYSIRSHDLLERLEELYNIYKNVEFTLESAKDGKLAFLDFLINVNENRKIRPEGYRKTNTYWSKKKFFQITLNM